MKHLYERIRRTLGKNERGAWHESRSEGQTYSLNSKGMIKWPW